MRKIIESTNITLDGFQENMERWHFGYMSHDDMMAFALEQLRNADALLMGRLTYDGFAQAWPHAPANEFTDRINSMPKYVVSDTVSNPEWENTTVIGRDDAIARVTALKEEDGGDILMYGHGPVARTLIEHKLLDEVRLWIHPIIAGGPSSPEHFLYRDAAAEPLKLLSTKVIENGVIIASYQPE